MLTRTRTRSVLFFFLLGMEATTTRTRAEALTTMTARAVPRIRLPREVGSEYGIMDYGSTEAGMVVKVG